MNPFTFFVAAATTAIGALLAAMGNLGRGIASWAAAAVISQSLKMANTWQKFVVPRAGKPQGVKGRGLFAIVPVMDSVVAVIDKRIQTTAFNAEQALTRDTVPVNVDAIIFWHVHDAQKAALAFPDYQQAIDRAALTSLREMIGSSMLAALMSDRRAAHRQLCEEIGRKTVEWGVTVRSVVIRDVAIPAARQAEGDARLLLALGLRLARHRVRADGMNPAAPIAVSLTAQAGAAHALVHEPVHW